MKKIKGWITTTALVVLFVSQAAPVQAGIIFGGLSATDAPACTDPKSPATSREQDDSEMTLGGIIFGGLAGIIFGGNMSHDACNVSGGEK